MKILDTLNNNFYKDLDKILNSRSQTNKLNIDNEVRKIINEIINNGDKALFNFSKKYDSSKINASNILLSNKLRNSFKNKVLKSNISAFKVAIKNIKRFHKKQFPQNYKIHKNGLKTESTWKPIDSVGLYIPGGKAIYPSSLIMNAVPAKVAGVKRIVVVTPPQSGKINPYILALLKELAIDEIYQVGGAHAIAALAYGTESIKPVNKIFGPGNAYVTSAKKQVFGKVGIDLIAGPSEIVVVADKNNNPEWVASDLIAQAEHDVNAQSILITDDKDFSNLVLFNLKKLSKEIKNNYIVNKSLNNFGIIILTNNLDNSHKIINHIAPEHLHLQNKNKKKLLKKITNAGAIFIGEYATEVFGDYIVGTNHVLPTSGSAKFSSGLGVLDFMKRTSVVHMDYQSYNNNMDNVIKMANIENLEGHKLSIKIRQKKKK